MADQPTNDIPQLSADGAIENQPWFRQAANSAWNVSHSREVPAEAEFVVRRGVNGIGAGPIGFAETTPGHNAETPQNILPSTIAAVHTHPDGYGQEPSPADIAVAKRIGKPVMVISRQGLYEVDGQGTVRQVFKGTDWMKAPKKGKDKSATLTGNPVPGIYNRRMVAGAIAGLSDGHKRTAS